jgi:tryptophan synthase beta chain
MASVRSLELAGSRSPQPPTILFNLSGHGHFDMQAYSDYFGGKLEDQDYDPKALEASLAYLPKVAAE